MKLTDLQNEIVNSEERYIYVNAAAASGKTRVLTERVRAMLRRGIQPSEIAVITYTRMAAGELKARLEDDFTDSLFIGTIHSLAAHFIKEHGDAAKIASLAEDDEFDEFFEVCKDYDVSGTFRYVLLDESQDISTSEATFIFDMLKPYSWFTVGDIRQTIYSFKPGCGYNLMEKYVIRDGATRYSLNENFRNGRTILKFAASLLSEIGLVDDSVAKCTNEGRVIKASYNQKFILEYIEKMRPYKSIAFLTRDNKQLEQVAKMLKEAGIPYISFKQGSITNAKLKKFMNDDVVKLLTIHSSKGLEFDNVFVYGVRWWESMPEEFRIMYVGATRARHNLIWLSQPKVEPRRRERWRNF